jgi:DNA-binding winged helix-turn-helix (wHTH) protein
MGDLDPKPAHGRIDLGAEPEFDLGGMQVVPSGLAVEMDGGRRELQPRVMRVLVALAKARPAVASRESLIEQCWDGRIVGDDAINRCILALRHLAGEFTPSPFVIETVPRVGHRLLERGRKSKAGEARSAAGRGVLLASAAAMVLLAGILLAELVNWPSSSPHSPIVMVAAAEGDRASRELARGVAAKLAGYQPIESRSMKLLDENESLPAKPDLILRVAPAGGPEHATANLVLTSGPDAAMLWSREFEQPYATLDDLQQQMAVTGARVLGCADEAMDSSDRLSEQNLRAYLAACVALPASAGDVRKLIQSLKRLVSESPRFRNGWAKLLAAETQQLEVADDSESAALRSALRHDIVAARSLEPHLAEGYAAEFALAPPNDFVGRSRLLDAAVAHNPNHADLRKEHSEFLGSVGRDGEAVTEARKAVELDPISPAIRDTYITALAIAGRMDAARTQLSAVERLWPGAERVVMARYRLELRFGDPRLALRILRSGAINVSGAETQETFLRARIDRSPADVERAVKLGRNVFNSYPEASDGYVQTLAEFDRKEELFAILQNWRRPDLMDLITGVLFRPAFSEVYRDPRFMRVAEHLGLLSYWRITDGWPDFCVAPDLPYDCKAEAARLAKG